MLNHENYKNIMDSIDLSNINDDKIYELAENSITANLHSTNIANTFSIHKQKSLKTYFKVALTAAALVTLSCISVFAYENYTKYIQTNRNAGNTHEYASGSDTNTQELNSSKLDGKLNVTVKKVTSDNQNMYIIVNVATKDGSPLMPSYGFDVASANSNRFETAYITDGTQKYPISTVSRTDDMSDEASATFELHYKASSSPGYSSPDSNISNPQLSKLKDSKISLVLNNFTYPIVHNTDIKFNQDNMLSVFEKVSSGNEIAFSNEYSDVTIVKMEKTQYTSESDTRIHPALAITYNIPNKDNIQDVVNFMMFNRVTGVSYNPVGNFNIATETLESIYTIDENGFVTVTYTCTKDSDFPNNLENYILTGDSEITREIIAGDWTFEIPVEISDELVYEPNQTFIFCGDLINIYKVELTDSSIYVHAQTIQKDIAEANEDDSNIAIDLVMSDGTKISAGDKYDAAYSEQTGLFYEQIDLETLVDSEDVIGFYIRDFYISLK